MEMQYTVTGRDSWLDRPVTDLFPKITIEKLLMVIIIIMTLFSRFYILGERVMSHDEVNHVVPSYSLYQGKGYAHDPVTHGPMQFHLVALSYFLLGDSDFSARTPAALFSVATVLFVMFAFRSYLGRLGALIGGLLFTISPYLLFYGRYTRNEAFVALFAVLTIFLMLRYLERGHTKYIYGLAAVFALQFITKETSFIYLAQFLVFVAFVFIQDAVRHEWKRPLFKYTFVRFTIVAIILLLGAIAIGAVTAKNATIAEGAEAALPAESGTIAALGPAVLFVAGFAILLGVVAIAILIIGVGWRKLTGIRSFDLLMLAGTLVLPQLTAFPVKMSGVNPIQYDDPVSFSRTALFLVAMLVISTVLGLIWKPRQWLISAGIFYSIFITFYTTFFTNGRGFFTGIIGSLGYWLEQQGVNRGSQPWYYYTFLQIPVYEYLAALGAILAFIYGLKYWLFATAPGVSPYLQSEEYLKSADKDENLAILDEALEIETAEKPAAQVKEKLPVLGLLLFLSVINLIAYSLAGEKMPWLTVHIAVPMLLSAAWGFGFLVESIKWGNIVKRYALIALALLPVFLFALFGTLGSLLGGQPPFQGKTLDQLTATSNFTFSFLATIVSGGMLIYLLKNIPAVQVFKMLLLTFFSVLAVLTARVAVTSSFINYDTAKEFLVYAHAARGPKDILAQVDDISRRITGGKGIQVGYDNDSLYPYWWYFRDYPNHVYYGEKPTREIRNYQLVIVGQDNYSKVEPILKENFIAFEYPRLWWQTQVYNNITRERIVNAIKDPKMRAALFEIWLNRDYTDYATLAGKTDLTLETWQPSTKLRLYIRKDILSQIWNFGAAPQPIKEVVDPYKEKLIQLESDLSIGQAGLPGGLEGQFTSPRGIAAAPDDSVYVADAGNHRIQHFGTDGKLIKSWGTFADISKGDAPGGTFFEPWGVAVGPDGSVYVTDTWNHRIQKFTSDGRFITMWGNSGQADSPTSFYGPRGIAVDKNSQVYVTDTGNKRVVVFDQTGKFITQFGEEGAEAGMFDEPVGIAIGPDGNVYVADTWNQRIQVFAPSEDGKAFFPTRSWDVNGWLSQSLDNKPFLAVDANNNVFVTDPEGYRILQFEPDGKFVRGWGEYSPTTDGFGLPLGIATGPDGKIWVSDSANSVILRFTLP